MKTMLALVAALALPSLALADDYTKKTDDTKKVDTAAKLADDDVKLIAHFHHVNVMEIDMGKSAAAKGSMSVRKYAQTLMKDHSDGDKDLVAFAKKKGLAKIPADTPATEAEKKEMADTMAKMAELKKLKGAEFDRQYLMMMVDGHDKEIVKLDAALPNIKDVDLASKMRDKRVVLQRHADGARDLQKNAPTASNDTKTDIKDTKVGRAVTDKK
jgi:putative membrane protein